MKYKQEEYENVCEEMPIIKHFDSSTFALILPKKAIVHDNLAVRKYCVKTFLKFNIHIKNFEHFIYSSLFEILNTAVFYKDATYEEDSKFYPILTNYFAGIFTDLQGNELRQNLRNLLLSIEKYTTYGHPLISLFNVFEKISPNNSIDFLGIEELLILEKILKTNYEQLQNRKRIQLFNSIMHLIYNFVDYKQINFSYLKTLLNILPSEMFTFKSYLHTSSEFSIFDMAINKKPEPNFLNNLFLSREKLFLWLIILPVDLDVLKNIYQLGNSSVK